MASFLLRSMSSTLPRGGNPLLLSSCNSRFLPLAPIGVKLCLHSSPLRIATPNPTTSGDARSLQRVQELSVPHAWVIPSIAVKESEWLRETLHKWLDDEYCPEPTNVDISRVAAKSYYESLISQETDLGEILLRIVADLETLSYRDSFHGPFSSANAAVQLITERMESIADK